MSSEAAKVGGTRPAGWSDEWEREIYAQGAQLNRYPVTDVVSLVHRHVLSRRTGSQDARLSALEIGCGTGPNLLFLAAAGFDAFGIDGSSTAIDFARRQIEGAGLSARLAVHDFTRGLPFPDGSMDLVLDRGALTHNTRAAITATIGEIRRVLKPGGHFISVTFFSTANDLARTGRELEPNTRVDLAGDLAGTGIVHFTSRAELEEMLSGFELLHLAHHVIDVLTPAAARSATYSTVARKPLDAGA